MDHVWKVNQPPVGRVEAGQSNEKARQRAKAKGGKVNASFRQPDEVCTAYVALWLRGRVQTPKGFWTDTDRFETVLGYKGTGKRYYPTQNFQDLAIELFKKEKAGTTKRRKQTEREWIRYVESGPNESKILAYRQSDESQELGRVAADALSEKGLVLTGLTGGGRHHAVGFDCSDGATIYYFDPLIGELSFGSVQQFIEWVGQNRTEAYRGYTLFTSHHFILQS